VIGRREFITLLCGAAAAWPFAARAQQAMPVVGILALAALEANAVRLRAFREGLRTAGYVEGQNVKFEYRWAGEDTGRLRELAAELVRDRVAVLVTAGGTASALAAKASNFIALAPRSVGYPRSVAATFDLAITHAVDQCAECEALIAYLAQCAPERISAKLLEGAVESEELCHQALAVLVEMSLVKPDPFADGTPAVMAHRLVQTVARKRSLDKGTAQAATRRLISRLLVEFPSSESAYVSPQSWPICATLVPHVLAHDCLADEERFKVDVVDLMNRAGRYLEGRGSYNQAEQVLRKALAICDTLLERNHPKTADTLSYLGSVLQEQGHLGQAAALIRRAIEIYEVAYGPENAETATALSNLGTVYQDQGEFETARSLYERVPKSAENSRDSAWC
jgi:tetratricopeptide (TPR) repeat protein